MCLSVRMLISGTTRPNFTYFYQHVTYERNPIFLPLAALYVIRYG